MGGTTPRRARTRGIRRPAPDTLPQYCDFACPHAAFAPPDASGACRRDLTVRCTLFRIYTTKHAPCAGRRPPPA
jgi:hypothetical protein